MVADPRLSNLDSNTITWSTITNDFALRSGSPAVGTGPNGLDMGGLVPGGASISGEPPALTSANTATLTIGGPAITSYRWKTNNGAYSAETDIAQPLVLSSLANGDYTVYVIGKNDAGVWQSTDQPTASKTWTVNLTLRKVVINEVMAINDAAVPVDGKFPDWIELYNPGRIAVVLTGMGLTDDPADPFKYTIPGGLLIPGSFRVFLANNPDGTVGDHLGFALNAEGDAVYLFDSNTNLVDSIVFGPQMPDLSIGRMDDGTWTLTQPTYGAANVASPQGDYDHLLINEWLASGRAPFQLDFVELYNRDTLPVNMGGLYMTDHLIDWPTRHQIAPLSFIGANGLTAFWADALPEAGPTHLSFKLSADQGNIALLAPDLSVIDFIFYGPQSTDISEGRRPDGSSNIGFLPSPTPGAPNPGPPPLVVITNIVNDLVPLTTQSWRYEDSGADLGTAWRETGYSDSTWFQGTALFGSESGSTYPYPFITFVPAPGEGGPITVYYRTHFTWTGEEDFQLFATNYLDDGAVYYLNDIEVDRIRVPDNPVLFDTLAENRDQNSEGQMEVRQLPTTNLLPGDNVLAVEVHQGSAGSSDDVFGMALAAVKSITNTVVTGVVLNEVLARNASFTNSDGTLTDWVELFNPTTSEADLSGMSLSDSIDNPRRWSFANGQTLAAGAYLLVRFDGNNPATNSGPYLNTGFGLNADSGDEVYLFDAPAAGGVLLDAVTFGIQAGDFSISRLPDGAGGWALTLPTPGGRNIRANLGPVTELKINEWMANPKSGDDWFELYNPNPQPVELGGLYLTDDMTARTKSRIPNLSFLGAGADGFVMFHADSKTASGANHVDFKLSAGGEAIGLFTADGTQIDSVMFGPQAENVSEGRFPDGSETIRTFPAFATPAESNLLPLEDVVVNEVPHAHGFATRRHHRTLQRHPRRH